MPAPFLTRLFPSTSADRLRGGDRDIYVDPYFRKTVLLLPFNGADYLRDYSFKHRTLSERTRNGQYLTPKYGDYALHNGGVIAPASTDWDFGSADWTVEFWCDPEATGVSNNGLVSSFRASPNNGWAIRYNASTRVEAVFSFTGTGVDQTVAGTAGTQLTAGTWKHVAVVNDAGTIRIYVDGVQGTSAALAGVINPAGGSGFGSLDIHSFNGGTPNQSKMDDLRITKGYCRYPAGTPFSPPAAFDLEGQSVTTVIDPYIADNVLLAGMDPSPGAGFLVDESILAHAFTANGGAVPYTIFGAHGAGIRDGYLTTPHHADLIPAAGEAFTIEAWVYVNALGQTYGVVSKTETTGNQLSWALRAAAGTLNFYFSTNGTSYGTTVTLGTELGANVWHHVAVVRDATTGVIRTYVDGGYRNTATNAGAAFNNSGTPLEIKSYDGGLGTTTDIIVDEVRMTKGVARYTGTGTGYEGAFAVPNGRFPRFESPTFSSGTTVNYAENDVGTVYTAVATGIGTISYSIFGGADSADFAINSSSGVLTFVSPPDYETPGDADTDNDYIVIIRATDASTGLTKDHTVTVTVTDVAEGTPARSPSYYNPGGRDYRAGLIAISTTLTMATGTIDQIIDGTRTTGTTFTNGQAVVGDEIKFDFDAGAGIRKRITEVRWIQGTALSHGVWKFQGSNDGSSWTDVSTSDFTLGSSVDQTIDNGISTNAAFYRYYRFLGVSGTASSGTSLHDVLFKLAQQGGEDDTPAWTGMGGRGFRTDIIELFFENVGLGATSRSVVIDGGRTGNVVDWDASAVAGRYIQFNFPVSIQVLVDGVRLLQSTTAAQGDWKLQRSVDGTTWVDVGSSFTLGGALDSTGTVISDGVPARYWRLTTVSGSTSNSPWIHEIELRTAYVEPTNVNAPVFTSASTASWVENLGGTCYTATATDADGNTEILYSISGTGADDALFDINQLTGELRFKVPPDFEVPTDADTDNDYEVIIRAEDTNYVNSTDFAVTVSVTNEVTEYVDRFYNDVKLLMTFPVSDLYKDFSLSNRTIARGATGWSPTIKYGTGAIRGQAQAFAAASADWDFGDDDFTVEFWVYLEATAVGSNGLLQAWRSTGNLRGWRIGYNSAERLEVFVSTDGIDGATYTIPAAVGTQMVPATWQHVAFVNDRGTLRLYIDGVQAGSLAFNRSIFAAGAGGAQLDINNNVGTANNSGIDDLRITKNICRYPNGTTFTVPTELDDEGATLTTSDPDLASVVLLVGFDTTPGIAVDESASAHTLTNVGGVATVTTNNGSHDGALNAGEYSAPHSSDFVFAAGEAFTIEGWMRVGSNNAGNYAIACTETTGNMLGWAIRQNLGALRFEFSTNGTSYGTTVLSGTEMGGGTWKHFAVTREATTGVIRIYIDGVYKATQTNAGASFNNTGALLELHGGDGAASIGTDCRLEEFRITKGVCRYSGASNFTPLSGKWPRV
jgi:hypothetical protein